MRTVTALVLGALLATLAVPGVGDAQNSVQISGVIQSVDCGAQTVVLGGPAGPNTVVAGPYTAVLVHSVSIPLCALRQYVGMSATAVDRSAGINSTATRIDVAVAAVAPPPPYGRAYYPYYGPPFWLGIGIVLGPGWGPGPGFHRHRFAPTGRSNTVWHLNGPASVFRTRGRAR